jgi:hypothetical protein
MTSYRVCWVPSAILCAAVAIPTLGCSGDVESVAEPAGATPSAISSCNAIDAGGAWWNQDFPEQSGSFTVELDATPSADAQDTVVGLSAGEAASFTALAVIVRFNDAGSVDVRDGSGYRADTAYAYAAGHRYHIQIKVSVSAHRYSVAIREGSADYTTIATSYAFRTEQASATRLAHAAGKVDSATGSLDVCGVSVILAGGGTCMTVHAGDGFVSLPLHDATGYETLVFTAQPSGTDVDAVFGLSAGPATSFSDLAAAVRFAPSGTIDVRDGDGYRADMSRTYSATPARMWMVSDLTTHTYSVFEYVGMPPPADVFELARQFRFRTEQAGATHLDHLSAVVDGDHGSAVICATVSVPGNVMYSREGRWTVAPLANDDAVMTDGTTTTSVDAAGHVLATVDASGRLATDALGDAYLARIANDALTVEKYGPPLALAWRTTSSVASSSSIRAIAGLPDGSAAVAVGTFSDPTTIQVLRFAPDGSIAATLTLPGSAVVIDDDRTVTAWNDNGTLRIAAHTADGAPIWERAFTGQASITAMALEPDHELVFGGNFQNGIDFGGGPLMVVRTDDGVVDGFVAKLSSTGEHVFSTRLDYTSVTGIATNGVRTAVSGTRRTQFFYLQLKVFDADHAPSSGAQLFDNGRGGPVAMSPSGRIWWSFDEQFYLFAAFPYLLAYGPGR